MELGCTTIAPPTADPEAAHPNASRARDSTPRHEARSYVDVQLGVEESAEDMARGDTPVPTITDRAPQDALQQRLRQQLAEAERIAAQCRAAVSAANADRLRLRHTAEEWQRRAAAAEQRANDLVQWAPSPGGLTDAAQASSAYGAAPRPASQSSTISSSINQGVGRAEPIGSVYLNKE